jgi:hypothetical protein
VALDSAYEPAAFQLASPDFNSPYFMATAMNPVATQQQAQQHYIVSQPPRPSQSPQQASNNRQSSSNNAQNASMPTSSSSGSTLSSNTTKKPLAAPPGIFLPVSTATAPPNQASYPATYSTPYGVSLSVGSQQQTGVPPYQALYDAEQSFTTSFMQFTNAQQAQSPSGNYGSVTPPVQQQQAHNNNDNKTMKYESGIYKQILRFISLIFSFHVY